jgi:hypothetical protein
MLITKVSKAGVLISGTSQLTSYGPSDNDGPLVGPLISPIAIINGLFGGLPISLQGLQRALYLIPLDLTHWILSNMVSRFPYSLDCQSIRFESSEILNSMTILTTTITTLYRHSFIIASLIVTDKFLLYVICKIFKLLTFS